LAQILALLSLLKKLMLKELGSVSSVRFNNFLFCILLILSASGGTLKVKFWSTFFFQIVLLAPLLVTFSVDTQHRLPPERAATWPLTGRERLLLSSVSFALNPLFVVLFFGYLFWMGLAAALFFVLLALIVHTTVFAVSRLPFKLRIPASLGLSRAPFEVGGIAQEMWRELQGTLDFWVALLIAVIGTLYRLFGRAPEPTAFPVLSLVVGIAMSTVAQRMQRLDEGRALLRYRLLPIAGWKLLVTQDMTFLIPLAVMVSLLSLRTGVSFVSADYWLSCGPLEIRRSILAVLASLILDTQICSTLMSHCGRGRTFWKAMKLLHCSEDRQAFKYRAASWSPDLIDTVDFY
jgi:hypothetical protein